MLQAKNIFKKNMVLTHSTHTHTRAYVHTLDKDWTIGYNNYINVLVYLPSDFLLWWFYIYIACKRKMVFRKSVTRSVRVYVRARVCVCVCMCVCM